MHLLLIAFFTISLSIEFPLAIHTKKRATFSRLFTFILLSYGLIATELMLLLSSVTHLHSIRHIHVHIMRLFSEKEVTENDAIPFHHLLLFVLGITILLFAIAFLLSQLFLTVLEKNLERNSNHEIQSKILKKNTWLPTKYKLIVHENDEADAFSFTVIQFKRFKPHIHDVIVLTTKIIELLEDDEIEMVLAHEYSHVSEYDTRYSHLIFTIANIMFFDPVMQIFKRLINYRHETEADLQAVELRQKPKTLARALLKLIKNLKQPSIFPTTALFGHRKSLVVQRINLLIEYAEEHNLNK